uniref:ATP synthase membrane subunit f n=1 Tax=Neogobius melanostomus TaxID=47308 RepID=A0A8C6T2I3_9GOBI
MSSVPIVEKRLMDVKLGELGTWIGGRDFTPNGIMHPFATVRSLVKANSKLQKLLYFCHIPLAHNRYYNKYINVKKGGIGGVAMMLVGYVALSYMWEFDHIKHDRWRKYH